MKYLHEGHRNRLKQRFLSEGIGKLEDCEALELLLYYAIPQKDVVPVAKSLLEKFGNIQNVFSAEADELCGVSGISIHSASLFMTVAAIYKKYFKSSDKASFSDIFYDSDELFLLMVDEARKSETEHVWLFLFDKNERLISGSMIYEGSVNSARLDYRVILEKIFAKNAAFAVLMHNHPDGAPLPTSTDIETTYSLHNLLASVNAELREHYVVAGDYVMGLIGKEAKLKSYKSENGSVNNV